jgi:hypothetical protein
MPNAAAATPPLRKSPGHKIGFACRIVVVMMNYTAGSDAVRMLARYDDRANSSLPGLTVANP